MQPTIPISLLGTKFTALLDCGASVSIVGDEVIKLIEKNNLKCTPVNKTITFLKGHLVVQKCISLKVSYQAGSRDQVFLLAPGTIKSVLLGRDFLGPAQIGIFVGNNGWRLSSDDDNLIPFEPSNSNMNSLEDLTTDLSPNNYTSGLDLDVTDPDDPFDLFLSPMEVLANWDYPEIDETSQDPIEMSPLDLNRPQCLQAPTYLTPDQRNKLNKTLEDFLPMFTKSPGLCKRYEHTIDTGMAKPVQCRQRPMSPGKRKIFDEVFDDLLANNIIEPACSPWSSTAFLVPKSDGGLRFVVDYKPLNKLTVPDKYPVPRIDDMLAFLGSSMYMSTFDLLKGCF